MATTGSAEGLHSPAGLVKKVTVWYIVMAAVFISLGILAIVEPLVKGGYYHAGQVCVSVQRIFVHADIMPRVVEQLTERVRVLRVGDPTLPDTEVGPLILPKEVDRVAAWVREAVDSGGKLTTGGTRISDHVYAPTVVVDYRARNLKNSML